VLSGSSATMLGAHATDRTSRCASRLRAWRPLVAPAAQRTRAPPRGSAPRHDEPIAADAQIATGSARADDVSGTVVQPLVPPPSPPSRSSPQPIVGDSPLPIPLFVRAVTAAATPPPRSLRRRRRPRKQNESGCFICPLRPKTVATSAHSVPSTPCTTRGLVSQALPALPATQLALEQ